MLNPEFFKNSELKPIRSYILEGFINLTRYFTKAAYTKLLNEQIETHDIMNGVYDEDKDNKNGIKHLAEGENNAISYNKINSTLIFFHEGNDNVMFKIITKKSEDDIEYKYFLSLLNDQNRGTISKKITKLPDYQNFTQEEFYQTLKEVLDINNPIKKTNDIKNKGNESNLKSIEEIAKNYVFTADNFLKMILILIRIRANVPVIMMGETGCGKTSLITKLSELLNNGTTNQMVTIQIHAGITDNDIIKKIEMLEPKAEEFDNMIPKKKLWVFFDEINTCKSMGLISEIMCKRTYQGKKIRDNIPNKLQLNK